MTPIAAWLFPKTARERTNRFFVLTLALLIATIICVLERAELSLVIILGVSTTVALVASVVRRRGESGL